MIHSHSLVVSNSTFPLKLFITGRKYFPTCLSPLLLVQDCWAVIENYFAINVNTGLAVKLMRVGESQGARGQRLVKQF